MTDYSQYLQEGFNLPHDVVELPSRGKFYKNKKSALKVGYLTAMDENILLADNKNNDITKEALHIHLSLHFFLLGYNKSRRWSYE